MLTYFIRGSVTVRLTSCLTGLDVTKQVKLLFGFSCFALVELETALLGKYEVSLTAILPLAK